MYNQQTFSSPDQRPRTPVYTQSPARRIRADSLLGNYDMQSPAAVSVGAGYSVFGGRPTSRLEQLKRLRFKPEDKAERVARSLAALDQPERIHLTPVEWRLIAEDPDIEDQF